MSNKNKSKNGNGTLEGLEQSFSAAIRAVQSSPDSEEAWDHLEELADSLQKPDEVATVYRELLSPNLSAEFRDTLFERAVNFHEEWFGDNPEKMNAVLSKIIEISPDAEWAFERLTVVLTVAEKWDELLAVYDRTLASTKDITRQKQLLDDAANLAKNLANKPNRAVDYLQQQLALDLKNTQLASSLERLLERQDRWTDLIELWRNQIAVLSSDEGRAARLRIISCCLDNLNDPAQALDELGIFLDENPGDQEGCQQLESILAIETAPKEIRLHALNRLKANYDAAKNPQAAVAAIEKALDFAEPSDKLSLCREAGLRHAALGNDASAIGQYAALLLEEPSDLDAKKQLRHLATRSKRQDLHADALAAAADSCQDAPLKVTLLVESAYLFWDFLKEESTAIDLFSRVLDSEETEPSVALSVAHNLNELLGAQDRSEEQLKVLERLADLERAVAQRLAVLGEAARLANKLGDSDKALAFWNTRLETDDNDLEALSAIVDLLEQNERWEALVSALLRRADASLLPEQRRADLTRVANIQVEHLNNLGEAIDSWLNILKEFGEQQDVLHALDELMGTAQRWDELAKLLGSVAENMHKQAAVSLGRLGDIHRNELSHPDRAANYYALALTVDPSYDVAQTGLKALVDNPNASPQAVQALHLAYAATSDWAQSLALLEPQLSVTNDARTCAQILIEAADLQENRANDELAALNSFARALPLSPSNHTIEYELLRLSQATGNWSLAAEALRDAAWTIEDNPARAAHLLLSEGHIRENQLEDAGSALDAYLAVVALDPEHMDALHAVIRVSARAGFWDLATTNTVKSALSRDRVETPIFEFLESIAEDSSAWNLLSEAMIKALEQAAGLHPSLCRDLEMKIGIWYRDKLEDIDSAEAAAYRALQHDPGNIDTLTFLSELQRRKPGPKLIETLFNIYSQKNNNLDSLREAAEVALSLELDDDAKRSTVARLCKEASRLWVDGEQTVGEHSAQDSAAFAIDECVRLDVEAGREERAVPLLLDSAKLPFDAEVSRDMRLRAADVLQKQGKVNRAIDVYYELFRETPKDIDSIKKIKPLLQQENRIPELLVVLRKELEITEDIAERLNLRLDIARFVGVLEGRDERVQSLSTNLEEEPGHPDSIDAVYDILKEKDRYRALAELLSEQAHKLEDLEKPEDASKLWARVAALWEEFLNDSEKAIFAYTRVVELSCTLEALDALARLHLGRGDPAKAATWLRRRLLDTDDSKEHVAVTLKLARAQIQAGQNDRAVVSLETAFKDAPRNGEVRKLLLKQYRSSESWEPLARTLCIATEHIVDEKTILAYAREAAEIYHNRLGTPEKVMPVLERALPLDPDDRQLRSMLAEGLRVAGRLDEARELITGLLKDFGRRRSAERAQAHLLLARIVRAQGDVTEALEQLDLASKMDSQNVTIWQALAELARETGQIDRAERAYRTLLLMVRRAKPEDTDSNRIGSSEVLMELSKIADDQGQTDQAQELLESAFEALLKNDNEAGTFQARLLEREEYDLLKRVYETRLSYLESPRMKSEVLSGLADLLEGPLDNLDNALDARLKAIESNPGSPLLHDAAYALAVKLEQTKLYIEAVESQLQQARRNADAQARCELLLRMAKLQEGELDDLDQAWEYIVQAEATGVREVDVWRAGATLAQARDDKDEQMRMLTNLTNIGEDAALDETRADALYRLAEVQLASADTLQEGIDYLEQALKENPRYERSGRILRRTFEHIEPNDRLLGIYEQIARQVEDDEYMLLDYLERRAAHKETTPEQVREGVDLAFKLEEIERAESLMMRAVEIGQELADGMERMDWALVGLASRRKDVGDIAGSVKWLIEASEVAPPEEVFQLAKEIAELAAQPGGDITLAIKLYEQLLDRDPTARDAMEPLAEMYCNLGDIDSLERLVDEMLDSLSDSNDRNALRLRQATLLLDTEDRQLESVEILKDIILEDPQHIEAPSLLADYLQRSGNTDELVELLKDQFLNAQSRKDDEAIVLYALRLGKLMQQEAPDEAIAGYQRALDLVPDNRDLLYALVACQGSDTDPKERAEVMERILASEEDEKAAELALQTIAIYESLDDETSVLRVLELGSRKAPGDSAIRQRLEQTYRDRGDDSGLAEMLVQMAEKISSIDDRVSTLKEAALIQRNNLSNPGAAAEILRRVIEISPEEIKHRIELAQTLAQANAHAEAIEMVTGLLDDPASEDARVDLLRMRADMQEALGDEEAALADLEAAFTCNESLLAPDLEAALARRRVFAQNNSDRELERVVMLRLTTVLLSQNKRNAVFEMLIKWAEEETEDTEVLEVLLNLLEEEKQFEDMIPICSQLIQLQDGEDQIQAAERLAIACQSAGQLETAKEQLEYVYSKQPHHPTIRSTLYRIYEETGNQNKLANLLHDEANGIEDETERAALLRRAGMLLLSIEEVEQATPILKEALALVPGDPEATAAMADVYLASDDLNEATALIDAAIAECKTQRSPELCLLQHRKARIARRTGDQTGELSWMKQAVLSDRSNGRIVVELADRASELEDWDMAVWALRTITMMKEESPMPRAEVFVRQGRIALIKGEEKRAKLFARQAKQEDPDSEIVIAFLENFKS